jgi:hypothetical protein
MNIFILNEDPVQAAVDMCDRHVVKMILESAQILCGVFHSQGIVAPYKKTHENHPCSKWARASMGNYDWLLSHSKGLSNEYTRRYGKDHKTNCVIEWIEQNKLFLSFGKISRTDFVLAMPEEYRTGNAVASYRAYYMGEKRTMKNGKPLAKWKFGSPVWWKNQ